MILTYLRTIIKAGVNIMKGKREFKDPISRLLKITLMVFNVSIDNEVYEAIMTYISFGFIGKCFFG